MSQTNQVRWGLVSTANINRRLIPAIRSSERGDLVAVASRSRESADAYAAEWEIPQAFGSYEAMLASDAIDAVYIGLPNHLHAEWSIRAMQQGKHVLCEKPFALSLTEVDKMIDASQETGMVLAEAFMYRHHPQTKLVGEWVRNGRLGDVMMVRGYFSFTLNNRENVRLAPEWGGGCMWDVGVYPLSFAQYVMGETPQQVFGMQRFGESGVDTLFAGQLYYSDGRMAQIGASFETPFITSAEVIGSKGRLVLTRPFVGLDDPARSLRFYPAEGEPEEISVPEKELYLGEVEDMHAAILDSAPNYLSLAQTRDHVKTTLALYASARTGQVLDVE